MKNLLFIVISKNGFNHNYLCTYFINREIYKDVEYFSEVISKKDIYKLNNLFEDLVIIRRNNKQIYLDKNKICKLLEYIKRCKNV